MTFMRDWRAGKITDPEKINEAIESWHDGPDAVLKLHEHLGMTWVEYQAWAAPGGSLPPGDIPVWLLDVDGVINADKPGWSTPPYTRRAYAACMGREYKLRFAPSLIERIRRVHRDGLAEIRWASTWCCEAPALESALRLPHFASSWTEHLHGREATMAKIAAASQVIADGRRLVWTDDSVTPTGGELYDHLTFTPGQSLLITPDDRPGLIPADMSRIEAFCGKKVAA